MPQREDQVGELASLELGDELLVLVMAKLARVVFEDGLCRFARRGVKQNDRGDIVAIRLGDACDLLGQDPHAYPIVPRGEAKIDQLARAALHVFRGGTVVEHEQGVGPGEMVAGHPQLETTIEQLEEERFKLDNLKDKFNTAFKEHDDLIQSEKEKEDSYRRFDIRDREFIECRVRLCERMQSLERNLSRAQSARSVKSGHSVKSKASGKSKFSTSSSRRLSFALLDAASKAAKLQAEMEFLDKERELRRLQLEKEIAIASAEKVAIKRILDEERLAGDKEESSVKNVNPAVKQELKPDVSDENIKQERSFQANPYAPPFVPGSYLTPPFDPRKADPAFTVSSRAELPC